MEKKDEKTHWLQSPNKNYLGHWDLPEGTDLILTIKSAQWEEVKNPIINTAEAKRVVRFEENYKPMICNQTNAKSILNSTGVKYMEDSGGKKISLFIAVTRDRKLKEDIDCIRVRDEVVVVEKEKLIPTHPKWKSVAARVKSGVKIEVIRKHYDVTDENFKLLENVG